MSIFIIVLLISLVVSMIAQGLLVAGFVMRLRGWKQELIDDRNCPPATVILCLRGGDPFLSKCIDGLLSQSYPNFQICFMVDSSDDPSLPILESAIDRHQFDRCTIEILRDPLRTCSLKSSSLIQAIDRMGLIARNEPATIDYSDGRVLQVRNDFIALLDADTIPHLTWLRELATALVGESIGAATGNRWYMPERCTTGAMVRYVWNAAAIVQMYWYQIAWGGTLAIKLDSIIRAGMLERWRLSLCEDTMLHKQLRAIGQKVAFVPSLMMVNREDCTIASFTHWVTRQLVTARLYHPLWLAVVGHGFSSALILLWGWTMFIAFMLQGDGFSSILLCIAMLVFQVFLTSMISWLELAIAPIVHARGESTDWNQRIPWLRLSWTVWVTQWVYTFALVRCLFIKRIEWRGIDYHVSGPWKIQMLGYRPFEVRSKQTESLKSSL